MESLRIAEKNKIHDRLKQIEVYVKRNKNTLNSVSASDKLFIEKINKKNQEYADEIEVLNKRLVSLSNGSIDSELTSFPTLQRRGYGFGNIGPIEKNL